MRGVSTVELAQDEAAWHGMIWHSIALSGREWHDMAQHSIEWQGMA
jgi:hypothetical protein